MYARISFRGAKTCKIEKKSVFLVILTNCGGHDGQIKKNPCKNGYLGSIFIPENTCLGCFLNVLLPCLRG